MINVNAGRGVPSMLSAGQTFLPQTGPQPTAAQAAAMGTLNRNWYAWVPPYTGYFFRPDNISLDTYELMMETDETVQYALEVVILAVISRLGEYTHPKRKLQKFVRETLEGMRRTLKSIAAEILSALWAGFSASEILWKPDGQRIVLDSVETLHPRSAFFILDTDDASPTRNEVREFRQWTFTGYQAVIPLEKAVIYSHRKKFGNVYGYSRCKAAYKNWFIKDQVLAAYAKCLDRYGTPTSALRVSDANSLVTDPVSGAQITALQYGLQLLESLRTDSLIAYDAGSKGENQLEIVDVKGDVGKAFDDFLHYLNTMIFRALMVPSLVGDHDRHGSYSLGQQHFDTFTLSLDFILEELAGVLVSQLVQRLIEVNFGQQTDYGSFATENFQEDDYKLLSEVFLNCVNAGILRPENIQDLNYMRERLGAPLAHDEDMWQYQPLPEQIAETPSQNGPPGDGQNQPGASVSKRQVKPILPSEMRSFSEQPPASASSARDSLLVGVRV